MPSVLAYHELCFFLLLCPLFVVIAQNNNGNIRVGDSLTADNEKAFWLSPSEDFAFGFYQLEGGINFLVAIWYYKIQQDNIVWFANGDNPAPRRSKLELTADDGLILTNPQGDILWRSQLTLSSSPVQLGVMNDTGNFQLVAQNSQVIRWESFKNPNDTLLPTQVMELGVGGGLTSRKRPNDFSTGGYQFRLLSDGNVVLNRVNLPTRLAYDAYYESGTNNETNSGQRVIFDKSGYLQVELQSGAKFNITAPTELVAFPAVDYYHRITLSFHGVLSLSYYPKTNQSANSSWIVAKVIPENYNCEPAREYGPTICGYNSICIASNDQIPTCECPQGYSHIDSTNKYDGCKPDFSLVCDSTSISSGERENDNHVSLIQQSNINWAFGDYEKIQHSEIDECKKSCLQDCFCAAVVYNAPGKTCWKKRFPLSNGREERGTGTTSFIKISNVSSPMIPRNDPVFQKEEKGTNATVIILLSLLGSSVFVNFVLIGVTCLVFILRFKKRYILTQNESFVKSNLQHFAYKELSNATNGFEREIGRGSCGVVYEGKTDQFGVVAVKMLDRMFPDNDKEFQVEVNTIGQTHHKNLLRLIGYCDEEQHRLLVFEFMKNGTLADFLFGGLRPSWYQRIQITFGIARGLVYLHEECSTQIIHCDIKPQNILLDEYYNARISDFGLAKLLLLNQSHTKTNIRGTKGYVAPDWFRSAPISIKVDVYSFGVLLIEIICCRRNVLDMNNEESENIILVDWACDCYAAGRLESLVENDSEAMSEIKMVERFVMVAIWCLQEDPSLRPTMKKALLMLEGIVQVSGPPLPSLSSYTLYQ